MPTIKTDNGEVIVESHEINIKIASNRDIYIKKPGFGEYKYTNHKVPLGKSFEEKVLYALKIRAMYLQKLEEDNSTSDTKTTTEPKEGGSAPPSSQS